MVKKSRNRSVKDANRKPVSKRIKLRRKKTATAHGRGVSASPIVRLQREEITFLRREYNFLKGKCERLELALMEHRAGPPASYVARTDQAARPPIDAVEVAPTGFRSVLSKWNSMSLEEQEEAIKDGNWDPEADTKH